MNKTDLREAFIRGALATGAWTAKEAHAAAILAYPFKKRGKGRPNPRYAKCARCGHLPHQHATKGIPGPCHGRPGNVAKFWWCKCPGFVANNASDTLGEQPPSFEEPR